MIRFVFLFLLCLHAIGWAKSVEQVPSKQFFEPFFREILTHTEAGYVLLDQKPVCMEKYCENSIPIGSDEWHRFSCAFHFVKTELENDLFRTGNIIFHVNENEQTILIINRKLFTKTVSDNLSLFQYVLGPEVTPESLLESILSEKQSFMSLLGYDKALVGIVLGYGAQNSLYHSRMENILEATLSQDEIPFRPKYLSCHEEVEKDLLLFRTRSLPKEVEKTRGALEPSFGFSSLEEEMQELSSKFEISSKALNEKHPNYIFGNLKGQNFKLLQELEAAQSQIQTLLNSTHFLDKVFTLIIGKKVVLQMKGQAPFSNDQEKISGLLAKVLKNDLEEYDPQYYPFFIEGLLGKREPLLNPKRSLAGFPDAIENIQAAKKHVDEADHLFQELQNEEGFISLADNLLFYKTLREGVGTVYHHPRKILLSYEIFDPTEKCLATSTNQKLDLTKTFSGLSYGLQHCRQGEKREIYIHPALAYGVHTYLDKGIYLKVLVEVEHVEEEKEIPSANPLDLSSIQSKEFHQECIEEHKNLLIYHGKEKRKFLLAFPGIDLPKIAEEFSRLDDNSPLTKEETDTLNRFFWNAYFSH